LRGMGCGYIPEPMVREELRAGTLVQRRTLRPTYSAPMGYAWRCANGAANLAALGLGLQWWLKQLASAATRRALLERHSLA
jgi:DNA-binding transcriptional LysR family regulator